MYMNFNISDTRCYVRDNWHADIVSLRLKHSWYYSSYK